MKFLDENLKSEDDINMKDKSKNEYNTKNEDNDQNKDVHFRPCFIFSMFQIFLGEIVYEKYFNH